MNLKKAIITGANRSIGQAIALTLAPRCTEMVITYHQDKAGAEQTLALLREKKIKPYAYQVDFSKQEEVDIFIHKAIQQLGKVDILINNAAITSREQLFELAMDKVQRVFQTNTFAPLYLAQKVSENMLIHKIKGVIINISSIASLRVFPRGSAYAASKAALNKFTENLSLELAKHGIRVNAIAPGLVEAGMNATTREQEEERWQMLIAKIPLGTAGSPQDISNFVDYLVSDEAHWITGKIFQIDGGQFT